MITAARREYLLSEQTVGLTTSVAKAFFRKVYLNPYTRDDLLAEGMLGAVAASQEYDSAKGAWSTFAFTGIRNAMNRYVRRNILHWSNRPKSIHGIESNTRDESFMERHVPYAYGGRCYGCNREHLTGKICRGLCVSCDRARTRAKAKFGGQGICECGRVMRSRSIGQKTEYRIFKTHCECGDPTVAHGIPQPQRARGCL